MLQASGKILPKMTMTCGAKKRRDCVDLRISQAG